MYLGSNLKYLIKKSEINQTKIAKKFAISDGQMSSYINGTQPKLDFLIKVSEYFNVSIDTLLKVDLTKGIVLEVEPKNTVIEYDKLGASEPASTYQLTIDELVENKVNEILIKYKLI